MRPECAPILSLADSTALGFGDKYGVQLVDSSSRRHCVVWCCGGSLVTGSCCAGETLPSVAKQLVCGWKLISARLGFPDVTDFLAQRLAVSIVAARESVPKTAAIYGDLQQHRSSWRLRETSKTILDMQDSWRQDSEPFYRRGLHFCGDKDRQRRVYCHVIEEAAKLAVGPGTTCAEDDVVDCDLVVVICCGWNNVPKTGDKCLPLCRIGLVNLCSELHLLRHWEQDAVDMRTLLQIASGWANACSETSLSALTR